MPAGGFKVFVDGEVLPASDINDYLMQGILVFASEAARDSAIAGPDHGMFAFTTDTDRLWYYDGATWREFSPDVEFASDAARDAAIPSPVDGRYAYTTDNERLWKYDSGTSAWVQQPAAGIADFSNTATGTYSSGGIDYKYVSFTSSGTLTISEAGYADILLVGGGVSGGDSNRGGYGGAVIEGSVFLEAGSYSVVIGAGGSGLQGGGGASHIGTKFAAGTGPTNTSSSTAGDGAAGVLGPGAAYSSSITGSATNYSQGGPTSGSTPTPYGSGGAGVGGGSGLNGMSGIVIVRVKAL